ncbi:MAG: AbrB/MazE/SpoVT family DNA-binding domain-containing protein [Sphingomonas phyllosphaerae]
MENLLTTVDADGAITIPPDLLRDCGLAEGDAVTFELMEAGVRIAGRDPRDDGPHD